MRRDALLWISFGCFVGLGMADASGGAAWPQIRASFGVPLDALGLLLVTGTVAFTVSGVAMGTLMHRFGSFRVIAAATGGLGLALLAFGASPAWSLSLLAGLFHGLCSAP